MDIEPMRSRAEPFQTNLPAAASELVGRTNAVQHLRGLLSAYRVVTLTGPGGIGKTRLAFEVARGLFPSFQGDVRLVELVSLSDPGLVPSAVAGGLSLKLGGDEISAESVARAIGAQRLLLVLDNCEHVIDAAARLAETIVRMCPRTTILATSREILKIEGEYVYRVPPLDVPSQHEEPDDILGRSAVQLFIATTRAVHSDFSPNGENLPAIAAICRRLDGIPLAIDFAATRVATLGLQQVAASLNDHLGMLTSGRRTALPRHQTLRATLDWSYELLPEPERLVMRRLAVFAGDFTAEAASLVAADDEIAVSEVICSLANLVTKSLVTLEAGSAIAHHRLHETTRAYALEKLAESGEFDQVARRHANYYRDLFDSAEIELDTLPTAVWLVRYGHQIGQVRAALALAERFCTYAAKTTDPADGPIGNRLVGTSLLALGDLESARRHTERMLDRYVARKSHIIRFQFDQRLLAHSYHSRILWLQGFAEQAIRSVECLVVDARASDHPVSLANALLQSALVALLVGDLTLTERYVKALLELSGRHALESLVGRCFGSVLLIKRGDIGAGLELMRTAFASVPHNAFSMLFTPFRAEMADALGRDGKAAEGLSIIDEALARSERNEERWCVAELLRIKGELILRESAPQAATPAEEHFLQ